MANSSNKQPIFSLYPITKSKDTLNAATAAINNLQAVVADDQILIVLTVDSAEGSIVERVTCTFMTNDGETNSDQLVVLAVRDPESQQWHAIQIVPVAATTVKFSSPSVAPATVTFEFEGGITLAQGSGIGVGHTQLNGNFDNLHVILEGGTFTDDQTG